MNFEHISDKGRLLMNDFRFTKMNGLGNSFIIMDDLDGSVSSDAGDLAIFSRRVCSTDTGIGADGLILVRNSGTMDYTMVIYNADGSQAEMCGNGIRCFARFLEDEGMTDKKELGIETLAGGIVTRIKEGNMVEVDMGEPGFSGNDVVAESRKGMLEVSVEGRDFSYVSMGNPHAVAFVDGFDFDWRTEGARVEKNESVFPNHTNVEYVKIEKNGEMTMKVWERGCGETMACGTGACALAVAGIEKRLVNPGEVLVHLPGGDLVINYKPGEHVFMSGPAVTVCKGDYFS
jgi:diaminopimelate epimerase